MLIFKIFKESILMGIRELWMNKLRTVLSLLAITIGIFLIIGVLTVVDNLEKNLHDSLNQLGNDVIYIQKWPWGFDGEYEWWKYWNRPEPDTKEFAMIEKKITSAEVTAIALTIDNVTAEYKNNSVNNLAVVAGSFEYDKIFNFEVAEGRYFSFAESHRGVNSVILGHNIAQKLFPNNEDPILKRVKIRGLLFKVVGVFAKTGEDLLGMGTDEIVLIPFAYVRKLVDIHSPNLHPFIAVKGKAGVDTDEMKEEIRGVMRSVRHLKPKQEDNFALNQLSLISNKISELFRLITLISAVIGAFAILVGGFGIAVIMFVSVKERTNIIGIKKAIGAKSSYVLLEFLLESIILCLIGGLLGLFLVFVGTTLISLVAGMKLYLTMGNFVLGLSISIGIGILAGIVPAVIAARMNPVDAIRFK